MTEKTTRPTHLQVSSHFLHDALDYKARYRHCALNGDAPGFMHLKSGRCKCFVDLRLGLEAILKSLAAYHVLAGYSGEELVKKVESYRHHLIKPWAAISDHLPKELVEQGNPFVEQLTELPVSLRYRFDAWDFEGNREALYGETIGSDVWMNSVYAFLDTLVDAHNEQLGKHNRIVKLSDLRDEMMEPEYRRY